MLIDGVSLKQISNQQIPSNFLVEYWHNLDGEEQWNLP